MSRAIAFIRRLWAGDISLPRAFWEFLVIYGVVLNLAATVASMTAATDGGSGGVALALYLLPIPYNLFMLVAVWRSAARYPGRRMWADLARPSAVLCAVLLSLA